MPPKNDETESTEQDAKTQGATAYLGNGGHNEPPTGGLVETTDPSLPAESL